MSGVAHPAPGTTAWLLQNELRLAWRGIGGGRAKVLLLLVPVLVIAAHAGAWFLVRSWPSAALPPIATLMLGAAAWICISLMLSQSILQSVAALFDRGDLDLLLSSPIPTRSVFMARGLGIAFNSGVLYLCLLAPIANVGPWLGHAALLAIYPTMAGLALAVSALGIALTLLLVRVLGARRARVAAQVLGTLVGAGFFLCSQLPNLMGPSGSRALAVRLGQWTAPGGPLSPDSVVWLPARALQGELPALTVVLALGAAGLWLVVGLTHRQFLAGTQESVSGSARHVKAAPPQNSVRFRAGLWRNVLFKEWRLIARDPQLISQTLMQTLYLLPAMLLMLRTGNRSLALAMPAVVFMASLLVSGLAWITVAAEEAPELLGSSPNSMTQIRALKVLAALLPVWLLVSPVLVYLAMADPVLGLIFGFCLAGATVSTGAGQIWYPRQGKRTDMKRRAQGHSVVSIVELVVIAGWVATAWSLSTRPAWSPVSLLVAALGSGAVWLLGRSRRDDDGPGHPP